MIVNFAVLLVFKDYVNKTQKLQIYTRVTQLVGKLIWPIPVVYLNAL